MSRLDEKDGTAFGIAHFLYRGQGNAAKEFRDVSGRRKSVCACAFLTKLLIEKAERQKLPVIYQDENEVFLLRKRKERVLSDRPGLRRKTGFRTAQFFL